MENKVLDLIHEFNSKWVYDRLEIGADTFERRLTNKKWKRLELEKIEELHAHYIINKV